MRIRSPALGIFVEDNNLTTREIAELEGDENAMRAIVSGPKKVPEYAKFLEFRDDDLNFYGAVAMLNVLENKMQIEFHLLLLKDTPRMWIRPFCELAYVYTLQHRLQPYTVMKNIESLRYMSNFMARLGMIKIERSTHIFYVPPLHWKPKYLAQAQIIYD